jgi:hypothetical protein
MSFEWRESDEVSVPSRTEHWIGDIWLVMRENWGRVQYDDPEDRVYFALFRTERWLKNQLPGERG